MDIFEFIYEAPTEEIYFDITRHLEADGYEWILSKTDEEEMKNNWRQYQENTVILGTKENKKLLFCHRDMLNDSIKGEISKFVFSKKTTLSELPSGLAHLI